MNVFFNQVFIFCRTMSLHCIGITTWVAIFDHTYLLINDTLLWLLQFIWHENAQLILIKYLNLCTNTHMIFTQFLLHKAYQNAPLKFLKIGNDFTLLCEWYMYDDMTMAVEVSRIS